MKSFDHVFPGGLTGVVIIGELVNFNPGKLGLWRHNPQGEDQHEFISDIAAKHDLEPFEVARMVRTIAAALPDFWAHRPDMFTTKLCASTIAALRHFCLPDESAELRKQMTLLMVRAAGKDKFARDLINARGFSEHKQSLQHAIDNILDEGLVTADELAKAWTEMLKIRGENFISEAVAPFWQNLTIATVRVSAVAQTTMRFLARREMEICLKDGFAQYWHPEIAMDELHKLLEACEQCWLQSPEFNDGFEEQLVSCLARGEAGRVIYVLNRFGARLSCYDHKSREPFGNQVTSYLNRLSRVAIGDATHIGRYGVAAALADHLDDRDQADSLRGVARAANQRVGLNWVF